MATLLIILVIFVILIFLYDKFSPSKSKSAEINSQTNNMTTANTEQLIDKLSYEYSKEQSSKKDTDFQTVINEIEKQAGNYINSYQVKTNDIEGTIFETYIFMYTLTLFLLEKNNVQEKHPDLEEFILEKMFVFINSNDTTIEYGTKLKNYVTVNSRVFMDEIESFELKKDVGFTKTMWLTYYNPFDYEINTKSVYKIVPDMPEIHHLWDSVKPKYEYAYSKIEDNLLRIKYSNYN